MIFHAESLWSLQSSTMLPWKNPNNGDIAVYSSLLRLGTMDIRGWIILWLGAGRFPGHPKMFNSNCDLYTLDVSGDKHGCLQTLPTGRKNHPRLRTASLWSQRMLESDIVLRAGALGWPWGMGWWGMWEGDSGWGIHVRPWLIHVDVWQEPPQDCKVLASN